MNNFLFQTLTQKLPRRLLAKLGMEKKIKRKQSAKLSYVNELILSKFEATLLGALIGDCVGRRFEGIWGPNLTEMLEEFKIIKEKTQEYDSDTEYDVEAVYHNQIKPYTDDTALTRAVCDSLLNKNEFDLEDMANQFQSTYAKEPNRGYATGAMTLFKKLNKLKLNNELASKCLIPAMELFNYEGSYGNGAGMRCSPLALYTYSKSVDEMKLICELSTRLTHTHISAVVGALQQCYAVRLALLTHKSPYSFDFDGFYNNIIDFVFELEKDYDSLSRVNDEDVLNYPKGQQSNLLMYIQQRSKVLNFKNNNNINSNNNNNYRSSGANKSINNNEINHNYSNLLKKLNKLIIKCRKGERINLQRLYKQVAGCNQSAIESIPMALFAFMIASDPKCFVEVNYKLNSRDAFNEFTPIERVIFYAASFGGESHKIASMAGAIAGAFFSRRDMPRYLVEMCESYKETQVYAQKLFDISVPTEFTSSQEDIISTQDILNAQTPTSIQSEPLEIMSTASTNLN